MSSEPIFVGAAGVNFSAPNGSASAAAALPTGADGNIPKYVRVAVASGAVYFHLDTGTGTAANTDPIVTVSDSAVFAVSGNKKYSVWGIGAVITGTVTPLENIR